MYVYGLIDPQTNCICYIGKAEDVDRRLASHLQANGVSNLAKNRWITSLKRQGLEPQIVVLEHNEDTSAILEAETRWIRTGLQLGWPLLNMAKTECQSYSDKITQVIGEWLIENHREQLVDSLVDALLDEIQPKFVTIDPDSKVEKERKSTDLQRMVWAWRDANPDGTQAELREEFAARGIEITRSWVHTCWHKWEGELLQ